MLHFLKNIKERGFSLIEILVVLIIIIILSATAFINYRDGEENLKLTLRANKLAQDIGRVQEMAMGAEEWEGVIPEGGFGLYARIVPQPGLRPYILFADFNSDGMCDCGKNCAGECIEEIDIEGQGMKIKEMNLESGKTNHLHILFTPPDPTITFTDEFGLPLDSSFVEIVFCLREAPTVCTEKVKTITVNKAGLITVE